MTTNRLNLSDSEEETVIHPDFCFYRIEPASGLYPRTIRQLADSSSCFDWRFRDDPRFGIYSHQEFIDRPIESRPIILLVGDSSELESLSFADQKERLPAGFRPAYAGEIAFFMSCYFRQNGCYPSLGWVYLYCADIIPLESWPVWYRNLRGINKNGPVITSDCRVMVRIDPRQGIILLHQQQGIKGQRRVIAAIKTQ